MKVWWSERARSQVREIFEFIAQDRPSVAERILFESYRLVYRVGTDEIAILSVRDTRMQQTEGEV